VFLLTLILLGWLIGIPLVVLALADLAGRRRARKSLLSIVPAAARLYPREPSIRGRLGRRPTRCDPKALSVARGRGWS
jgi:hypothetical protein